MISGLFILYLYFNLSLYDSVFQSRFRHFFSSQKMLLLIVEFLTFGFLQMVIKVPPLEKVEIHYSKMFECLK